MEALQSTSCTGCGTQLKITELLDHCEASWPEQHLLYFTCPHCRQMRHLKVRDDYVAIGYLDGAPGPRFVTHSEMVLPSLIVSTEEDAVELTLGDQTWFIRAKE